jgi:protein required for attachment to host cells
MVKSRPSIWYVVADATKARVVKLDEGPVRATGKIEHVVVPALNEEFIAPNLKSREVLADRGGQRTPGHPAFPADPHKRAKAEFALELARVLEKALNEHRFEHLILIAPPEMLGKIRAALTDEVKKRVLVEEDKDLTQLPDNELAQRLAELG